MILIFKKCAIVHSSSTEAETLFSRLVHCLFTFFHGTLRAKGSNFAWPRKAALSAAVRKSIENN